MNLKNKKLITVFVVPVVIIAAVAGYFVMNEWEESLPEVHVQEGFAEMTVEYQPPTESRSISSHNIRPNVTSTTYIDTDSILELSIYSGYVYAQPEGIDPAMNRVRLFVRASGSFEEYLSPKTLEFRVRGLEGDNVSFNSHPFISRIETGLEGSYNPYGTGTNMITSSSNILSNNFSKSIELIWQIPNVNLGNPYTLEIQAVVGGFAEEVVATIHVHIDLFSKITSFEASIDKEHYFTSDYPSEEDVYYVYPEINYKFENMPGGEEVLYDVDIYAISSPDYVSFREFRIFSDTDKKANEYHEAITYIEFYDRHAEFEEMEFELRFVITQQDGNWSYDTQEDENFHMMFTITHDGGGEE